MIYQQAEHTCQGQNRLCHACFSGCMVIHCMNEPFPLVFSSLSLSVIIPLFLNLVLYDFYFMIWKHIKQNVRSQFLHYEHVQTQCKKILFFFSFYFKNRLVLLLPTKQDQILALLKEIFCCCCVLTSLIHYFLVFRIGIPETQGSLKV